MIVGIRRYLIGLHSWWQWDGRSSGCELGPTAAQPARRTLVRRGLRLYCRDGSGGGRLRCGG